MGLVYWLVCIVMGLEIGQAQLEAQFMGYGCVYINNLNPHVLCQTLEKPLKKLLEHTQERKERGAVLEEVQDHREWL